MSSMFCEAYSGQEAAAAAWSRHNTQISTKAPRGRVESHPAYTVVVGGERSCTARVRPHYVRTVRYVTTDAKCKKKSLHFVINVSIL